MLRMFSNAEDDSFPFQPKEPEQLTSECSLLSDFSPLNKRAESEGEESSGGRYFICGLVIQLSAEPAEILGLSVS